MACVAFGPQHILQEVGVAGVLARRRRLRNRAIEPGHGQEPKFGGQRRDAVVLEGAHGATSGTSVARVPHDKPS